MLSNNEFNIWNYTLRLVATRHCAVNKQQSSMLLSHAMRVKLFIWSKSVTREFPPQLLPALHYNIGQVKFSIIYFSQGGCSYIYIYIAGEVNRWMD